MQEATKIVATKKEAMKMVCLLSESTVATSNVVVVEAVEGPPGTEMVLLAEEVKVNDQPCQYAENNFQLFLALRPWYIAFN